uniref:Receptor-like protein 12 n=1 Tax=Tanacetum cinerariifolium TaxID=118510 RepID=A0A6L2LCD1_TANCI|nr:receptor-like protein 12 [Tanacetum cinerariifolium]
MSFKHEWLSSKPDLLAEELYFESCIRIRRSIPNWNTTSYDSCKWEGITCNPLTGDVIGLDLACGALQALRGNQLARRVMDDLIELSGQTFEEVQTCQNQIAQLNALISEMEAFDDPREVFDTLIGLRDDIRVKQAKSMRLNELVTQVEEEIEMKEAQLEVDYCIWCVYFEELDVYLTVGSLAKLSEVVESPRLVDKMKYVFSRSRGEDESFAGLIEVEGVVKCLEHMRVIVARDVVTLGELETLLGHAQVGVSLKAGFVANMDVKD